MNEWIFLCKMAESNMAEYKMAAIINLRHIEWVEFFCANGGNQSWQVWVTFRGHTMMAESKNAKFKIAELTQDSCHHQVKWEWMSLSKIELVWVSIRVEWECFWVNVREDNKMSESKMAVSESNMAEFKMAAIIKLSQNEWVKFFCANGGNQSWQVWVSFRGKTKMAESKMT